MLFMDIVIANGIKHMEKIDTDNKLSKKKISRHLEVPVTVLITVYI